MQPHQGHARLEVLTASIRVVSFRKGCRGTMEAKGVLDKTLQAEAANVRGLLATETLRIA